MARKQTFSALIGMALAVVAVGAWVAFAGDEDNPRHTTIDERVGTYGGVGFGLSEQGVIRVFGEPNRDPGFAPAGKSPAEVGVPQSIPGGSPANLKYEDVAFLLGARSGVHAFIVTKAGATTKSGVTIGDSMDEARSTYHLKCIDVAGGESLLGGQEFYPSCGARVKSGWIWFGRDPIRSITLVSG